MKIRHVLQSIAKLFSLPDRHSLLYGYGVNKWQFPYCYIFVMYTVMLSSQLASSPQLYSVPRQSALHEQDTRIVTFCNIMQILPYFPIIVMITLISLAIYIDWIRSVFNKNNLIGHLREINHIDRYAVVLFGFLQSLSFWVLHFFVVVLCVCVGRWWVGGVVCYDGQ